MRFAPESGAPMAFVSLTTILERKCWYIGRTKGKFVASK